MTLLELDHLQLSAPDGCEAAARAFYGDLLGLAEVAKPPALAERGGCWFSNGSLAVHIGVEGDFRPNKKAHPAFRVQDFQAAAAELVEAGYPVEWDDLIEGVTRFYTTDPWGNRLEFLE